MSEVTGVPIFSSKVKLTGSQNPEKNDSYLRKHGSSKQLNLIHRDAYQCESGFLTKI